MSEQTTTNNAESKFTTKTTTNDSAMTAHCLFTLEDKKGNEKKGWGLLPRTQCDVLFKMGDMSMPFILRAAAEHFKLRFREMVRQHLEDGGDFAETLVINVDDSVFIRKTSERERIDPVQKMANAVKSGKMSIDDLRAALAAQGVEL